MSDDYMYYGQYVNEKMTFLGYDPDKKKTFFLSIFNGIWTFKIWKLRGLVYNKES